MAENEVYMLCGHCNQAVLALVRATYRYTFDDDLGIIMDWRILQCGACLRPILDEAGSENPDITMLYPTTKLDTRGLPQSVAKAYAEALRVQRVSPNSCAVMIGRTLEVVCNEKQVEGGRSLAARLDKLASAGHIPPLLAEMAGQLRQIRNWGAHADKQDEVTESDVPILLDLLDAVLEYLYIAPRKVQKVEARLNRSRKKDDILDLGDFPGN
jgi:uncharacterized protein DUF4145